MLAAIFGNISIITLVGYVYYLAVPKGWVQRNAIWELGWNTYLVSYVITAAYSINSSLDLYARPEVRDYVEFHPVLQKYMAWYIYMTISSYLAPFKDFDRSMFFHHIISLALMVISYLGSSSQYGFVTLFTMSVSNPLMHLSKLLHHMDYKRAKKVAFAAFTLVFCGFRLVCFPILVFPHSMYHSLAYFKAHNHLSVYISCNMMLLALYALQWVWFVKIVRILVSSRK